MSDSVGSGIGSVLVSVNLGIELEGVASELEDKVASVRATENDTETD